LDNVERHCRALFESLMRFIHSQIITATIERPSCTSPGAPSLADALDLTKCPRPPPHNAVPVPCKAVLICPHGRRLADCGGSGRGTSTVGARPDGTTCCG
jgi:hypothetical protein